MQKSKRNGKNKKGYKKWWNKIKKKVKRSR